MILIHKQNLRTEKNKQKYVMLANWIVAGRMLVHRPRQPQPKSLPRMSKVRHFVHCYDGLPQIRPAPIANQPPPA